MKGTVLASKYRSFMVLGLLKNDIFYPSKIAQNDKILRMLLFLFLSLSLSLYIYIYR